MMPLDSPLTLFALAIPPIVVVIFVSQYWFKRDPISQPSIVAAIPLGLSSIAILLGQSAFLLLHTFNEISSRRTAGLGAVVSGLLLAQRPLVMGFLDFAVCLIIVFLISGALRFSRDEDTPLIHAYVSLPALIVTALILVALFLVVYLQYGTVDLVMKIVDTPRNHELIAQYGRVSPAYFAAKISSRLVAIFFLSQLEFVVLIIAGALDLFWRQKQNSRQTFAAILTLGTLVGCGWSALDELGFVDYLLHVH
jgi:hypothetical protein